MTDRQSSGVNDRLRAIEVDPEFTWESLQLHLRGTGRKIRMLLAMNVKARSKRKPRAALWARRSRKQPGRQASTLV
jgi:hypothetical protein